MSRAFSREWLLSDAPASRAQAAWGRRYQGWVAFRRNPLALGGLVVLGGVTHIKGRWLYPLLCMVPLMAFAWRPRLAGHPGGKAFNGILLGMAVGLAVGVAIGA